MKVNDSWGKVRGFIRKTVILGTTALLLLAFASPVLAEQKDDKKPQKKPGIVQFDNWSYQAKENKGEVTVNVKRHGGSDGKVTVKYCFCNANAQKNKDYVANNGVVTFEDGETSKTITIPIIDDKLKEPKEMFKIYLKSPTGGAQLGLTFTAWITIHDDDNKNKDSDE